MFFYKHTISQRFGRVISSTGTAAWPIIGPASNSAVTKCSVQPETFTPASRARSCVFVPGKLGSKLGCILSMLFGHVFTKLSERILIKPAKQTNLHCELERS